ncbi:MAG: sugar transferase [Pseudomonadota bacterium]
MRSLDAKNIWRSVAADISVSSYRGKRCFDIAGALILAVAFSPLAVCVASLVWHQSGRPVLFRHRRVGQGGRSFDVYKFRSMVKDAETRLAELLENDAAAAQEWAATHKLKQDPRVTAVGRFLRKTSLDELPQLMNVLMGEMSLVGPRPIVTQEMEKYGADLPCYLAVKPGLTGLWQTSGRNDVSYEERVMLDVQYACSQSLWGDLQIVLKTAVVLFKDRSGY